MQSRLTDWRIIIREHRKGELSALDAEPKRRRGTPVLEQIIADMISLQRNLGSFGSESEKTEDVPRLD